MSEINSQSEQSYSALVARVIAAEQELRAIRGALAQATRCICPVGWGAQPDRNCPKHGNRS